MFLSQIARIAQIWLASLRLVAHEFIEFQRINFFQFLKSLCAILSEANLTVMAQFLSFLLFLRAKDFQTTKISKRKRQGFLARRANKNTCGTGVLAVKIFFVWNINGSLIVPLIGSLIGSLIRTYKIND